MLDIYSWLPKLTFDLWMIWGWNTADIEFSRHWLKELYIRSSI